MSATFHNDDGVLLENVDKVLTARRRDGLDGLVGGLAAILINTDRETLVPAAQELVAGTALDFVSAFATATADCILLRDGFGADVLVQSRRGGDNPFLPYNHGQKTPPQVSARLETFCFTCSDLPRYVAIQQRRGVRFATPAIVETDGFRWIQTLPSSYTGNSLGFIQWKGRSGDFACAGVTPLDVVVEKPNQPWYGHIRGLDHVATRVRARDRDAAIVEFLGLTNYQFAFAVYVESLNSITNVARLTAGDYAQVFTSGISPLADDDPAASGPTEGFIRNYGLRPHHMAFAVEAIEAVVAGLMEQKMSFLSELIGSREEGLKQIFSTMSPVTYLVNEYIERYDGFDGFFTKSNVSLLTKATERQ